MVNARSRRVSKALTVILLASVFEVWAETDAVRQARIKHLENALLAPCCYAEPVARHQSEVSVKMRLEIQNLVNAGKTDEEVLAVYKDRYGAQVLAPPQREAWMWSDGIPWLLILMSGLGVVWLLSRWRAKSAAGAVSINGPDLPAVPESEEDWDRLEHLAGAPPQSPRR
jgi:cytochrome c-type biogenesis protein CcmH